MTLKNLYITIQRMTGNKYACEGKNVKRSVIAGDDVITSAPKHIYCSMII